MPSGIPPRKLARLERELRKARARADAANEKVAELEAAYREASGQSTGGAALVGAAPAVVEAALEKLPGLVYIISPAAKLQLVAGEGAAALGFDPHTLLNTPVTKILGEGVHTLEQVRAVLMGATREWEYSRAGRAFNNVLAPLRGPDKELLGAVGVMLDVSEHARLSAELEEERRQLYERVEERTQELVRANAKLEAANEAKDRFLASMSHELRTPLNAIIGLAEALLEGVYGRINDGQTRYLTGIVESGMHLLSLVNDILDIAKFQAGELELDLGPVDVGEVCRASIRMVESELVRKRLSCQLALDPEVTHINADERRLKQMLVNLLANALKFSEPDTVLGIRVRGEAGRGLVNIGVWDEGPGIPPDEIELLFRPFVQLGEGVKGKSGTGLGLSIVLSMAELHGGTVSVESEVGRGSEFTISLPWGDELGGASADEGIDPRWDISSFAGQTLTDDFSLENAAAIVALARHAAAKRPSGRSADVLVIDDNHANTRTLGEFLRLKGFQVHTASTGTDGITSAVQERPRVIILDMQMPGMNGLEVLQQLRARDETRRIPVIALSALALPGERRRCLAAGASEYLGKPVQLSRLESVIRTLVE